MDGVPFRRVFLRAPALLPAVGAFLLCAAALRVPLPDLARPLDNFAVWESEAFCRGRAWFVPEYPVDDVAVRDGRSYNMYPPAQTILWLACRVPLKLLGFGGKPPVAAVFLLLFGTLWSLFRLARALGLDARRQALFLGTLIFGTSYLCASQKALSPYAHSMYFINHLICTWGLVEFLCCQAAAPGGPAGLWALVPCLLSRELTACIMAAALGQALHSWWRGGRPLPRLLLLLAPPAAAAALLLLFNWVRFGHGLYWDGGYRLIYAGKTSVIALKFQAHGLFSAAYLGDNLKYQLLYPPWWRGGFSPYGVSFLLASPLAAVGAAAAARRREWLLAAVAAMFAAHMLFVNTGWVQPGFNRFSLDYLPLLLAWAVPALARRPRWWLAGALFSAVYFLSVLWFAPS